jgi:dCMP deaminase
MRPSWEEYFMNIAHQVKLRSPDTKRKVGAVMVSLNDKRIISCGYNGLVKGIDDNIDWEDREFVHSVIIHAESNCILYASSKFENSVLYITTSPCSNCIKLIAAANIKQIYYNEPYRDIELVKKLCKFFDIEIVQLS